MKQRLKTSINTRKIAEIFFYLFIFSLFFPIKYTFLTSTSLKLGGFSDFTSISLYLSDILLILATIFALPPRGEDSTTWWKRFYHVIKPALPLTIWLILVVIWHLSSYSSLNWYIFIKFLELVVAYGTFRLLIQETGVKFRFFQLFAALGTIQAGLAIAQFRFQHALGLFKLGEQQIYAWNQGIAKLVVNGVTYIRGYGTFPHPNPLSAFLVATILILIYLTIQAPKTSKKVIYSIMTYISILGLTTTFSRAGFLALGAGLLIYFGVLLAKLPKKQLIVPLGTILVSLLAAVTIYKPFLLSRATVSDQAVLERGVYNRIGLKMIKANPVFGVGTGESVLHMQQYSDVKLWPWQSQPIHNYFLLAAAELGIIGAVILIWIFLYHLWQLAKKIPSEINSNPVSCHLLLVAILCTFLVLMFFDHYFYTLQQTQLLLWLFLGIAGSQINSKLTPLKEFQESFFDIALVLGSLIFALYFSLAWNARIISGTILCLTGIAAWIIARYQLGDAFSVKPEAKQLVTLGLYSKISHPIYFASTISVIGLCLVFNYPLFYFALLLLIIIQFFRARAEERLLAKTYGEEFRKLKETQWF